jgi:hypothetical protein
MFSDFGSRRGKFSTVPELSAVMVAGLFLLGRERCWRRRALGLPLILSAVLLGGSVGADNRIQTENALLGTTGWKLTNPVTPGWPTNQDSIIPEIEGYASATSVNTNQDITFYVDVRQPEVAPKFWLEIFRMGYYSGLGARQMSWPENGVLTNRIELQSFKQLIPSYPLYPVLLG